MSLNGSERDRFGASPSPSAFDELSRYLTLQAYLPRNGGLFGSGWSQFMADRATSPPVSTPADPQQNFDPPLNLGAANTDPDDPSSSFQLAAASSPGKWPIPVPGCASCHGPSQPPVAPPSAPPLPPGADDPWTYFPDISRRNGAGWGTSPSRSGDDRKQCDIQESRDNAICNRQKAPDPNETPRVIAVCKASKMDRYGHCLATDEIGFPQLQTYKVQKGEPPIRRWRKPR